MNRMKVQNGEELEKIPVQPGDAVFIKYDKNHKPMIKVFSRVIPV